MKNLKGLVNFQPQNRYLVVCDNLISDVLETCDELQDTGLTILPLFASTKLEEREQVLSEFKQGSVLVAMKSFVMGGFYFNSIEGVLDVSVVFNANPHFTIQARHRFRPVPATVVAITQVTHKLKPFWMVDRGETRQNVPD